METSDRTALAVWSLAARYVRMGLTVAASLVVTPIIVESLGQYTYGGWVVLSSVAGYLGLADFGIAGALVRHLAYASSRAGADERSRLVSSAVVAYVMIALAVLVIGLGSYWATRFFAPDVRHSLSTWGLPGLILLITTALNLPMGAFGAVLRALQRQHWVDLLSAAFALVNALATVASLRLGWGVTGLALVTLVVSAGQGIVNYLLTGRLGIKVAWKSASWGTIQSLASFSVYLFMNSIAVALVFNTDNVVVGAMVGASAVTIYRLTYQPGQLLTQVIMQVSDAAFPGLTQIRGSGDRLAFRRASLGLLRLTSLLAFSASVLYAIFNKVFVSIWVGPGNYAGLATTLVFALLVTIHTHLHVFSAVLQAEGRVQVLGWVPLAEGVFNFALSVWLAQRLGLLGVAMGTLLASLITTSWYVPCAALRALEVSWKELIAVVCRSLALSLFLGGIALILKELVQPVNLVQIALVGLGVSLGYGLMLWRWGLDPDYRLRLGRGIRRCITSLGWRRAQV